jgi:hypothetical protein
MSESRNTMPPAGTGNFSAADLRRRMAEREAAKAAEEMRHIKEQEEKQKAVMAEFHKPPDRTAEQLLQQLVSRAAERGQSEVQVYRFPSLGRPSKVCSQSGSEAPKPITIASAGKSPWIACAGHHRTLPISGADLTTASDCRKTI